MVDNVSTIAALATAPVPAGVAVVRISGSRAKGILTAIFRSTRSPIDCPRQLISGQVIDPESGEVLDHALVVYMRAPKSFTGEDVVELHLHGSPLLAKRVLRLLFNMGIVPAAPGEFTKRAFLNGRLDLVQAEAVNELISAQNDYAVKVANEHLAGRFSDAIFRLGEPLRDLLSELEAQLDFPEEETGLFCNSQFTSRLSPVCQYLNYLLESYVSGRFIREGFRVLLAGAPNVGKSSLLNYFLGCERAIVTDISGTTRDILEETVFIDGVQFVFCDTAGITERPDDQVEAIGVERAKGMFEWADLVLWLVDASGQHEIECLNELKKDKDVWVVFNKIDLCSKVSKFEPNCCPKISKPLEISAKTGVGLEQLKADLVARVYSGLSQLEGGDNIVTSERQRLALLQTLHSLQNAETLLETSCQLELVSFELRTALGFLEELVGKTYSSDILNRIFERFCIGK